jgi:intracellular multiplication protein IcmO
MTLVTRNKIDYGKMLRDIRSPGERIAAALRDTDVMGIMFMMYGIVIALTPVGNVAIDVILFFALMQWWLLVGQAKKLSLKLPAYAKGMRDPNNPIPGTGAPGKPEGILYLGQDQEYGHELWLSNNDARTHILYLGTTGAGKTEGLKSMVANALCWGSGYAYTDGKADTDLWASLYAMARRFGRDDDLLILNYMTANSDFGAVSNTMNPFANGSASYLTQMIISLMPDAGGDNAMWKERAVALMSALMPALTYMRDKEGLLLDVGVVRAHLELGPIIRLSRERNLPERIVRGLQGYLQTLPGYVDSAFDDEGNEKPPSPDQPPVDLAVARQQHGYLSMQFTRSLQSLADEYGYIFKAQLADIDVLDVVLNRRIMVVLIPALEKSGDEAANLGKIVAASIKGMMGATLGNTVEGSWETAIESKQTRSSSSFMTVFDEVGYYTAQGMAVMAAQARSLGFSLVFAAQDLPAMEKRVKAEARSILGNCNLKIFGKLEDPTDTKDFLDKHAGHAFIFESNSFEAPTDTVSNLFMTAPYYDKRGASLNLRQRVVYDHLRIQKEGEAYMFFGEHLVQARLFHAVPEKVRALRVHRLLPVPPNSTSTIARDKAMQTLAEKFSDPAWTAENSTPAVSATGDLGALLEAVTLANGLEDKNPLRAGIATIVKFATMEPRETPPAAAQKGSGAKAQGTTIAGKMPPAAAVGATKTQQPTGLRAGDEMLIGGDDPANATTATIAQKIGTDARGFAASDALSVPPQQVENDAPVDLTLPDSLLLIAQDAAKRLHQGLFSGER